MTKRYFLFIALIGTLGCSTPETSDKTKKHSESMKYALRDPVSEAEINKRNHISQRIETSNFDDRKIVTHYNSLGLVEKEVSTSTNDFSVEEYSVTFYRYANENLVHKYTLFGKDQSRYGMQRKYEYENNLLRRELVWGGLDSLNADTIFYEYDERKNKVKIITRLDDVEYTVVSKYNEHNLKTYDSTYYINQPNFEGVTSKTEYNRYGWKIKETVRSVESGEILSDIKSTYDDEGKILRTFELTPTCKNEKNYYYDERGLLDSLATKMTFYSESSPVKRTYYYSY